jgi:hypothetical protein
MDSRVSIKRNVTSSLTNASTYSINPIKAGLSIPQTFSRSFIGCKKKGGGAIAHACGFSIQIFPAPSTCTDEQEGKEDTKGERQRGCFKTA